MVIPASAVGFACSGALLNVQSLESAAFTVSWHPGATGWQVRHGKLLDLVMIHDSETMFCASKEVLAKVLKEYAKRCCWIVLREKIVTLLIMTTECPRCTWDIVQQMCLSVELELDHFFGTICIPAEGVFSGI
jgi:hypothetical protein